MRTDTDWLELSMSLHRQGDRFLLPWKAYAEHFSDPLITDCYIPLSVETILGLSRQTSPETNYAVIRALAVYAELGLKRERLN